MVDVEAIAIGIEAVEACPARVAPTLSGAAPRAEHKGAPAADSAILPATRPLGSVLSHTRLQQRRAAAKRLGAKGAKNRAKLPGCVEYRIRKLYDDKEVSATKVGYKQA